MTHVSPRPTAFTVPIQPPRHHQAQSSIQIARVNLARRPRVRRTPSSRRTWTNTAAAAAQPADESDSPPFSTTANPPPPGLPEHVWETLEGCEVLSSAQKQPTALLIFTGGLGAGSAPRTLYGTFLRQIAEKANVAIIAPPLKPSSFDHSALALDTVARAADAARLLVARYNASWIPVFAMGHSLGAKLILLACCDDTARTTLGPVVANIFLSFNNFTARQSIPVFDTVAGYSTSGLDRAAQFLQNIDLRDVLGSRGDAAADVLKRVGKTFSSISDGLGTGEFTPSPQEVLRLVRSKYNVRDNLVIRFSRDTLDETETLVEILRERFGQRGCVSRKLEGTHVTPLTPSFGNGGSEAFAGVGNESIERELRKVAGSVEAEMDAAVTVVVAFVRLHLEVLVERRMLS